MCKANNGSIKKGERRGINTEFIYGQTAGSSNINWKGDSVGYYALHTWVKRTLGVANKCEVCQSEKNVEWANKSWEYQRDKSDWIKLCKKHHIQYDRQKEGKNWGIATKKFNINSK